MYLERMLNGRVCYVVLWKEKKGVFREYYMALFAYYYYYKKLYYNGGYYCRRQ